LYREFIKRRIGREPLQYITGVKEFWSMEFQVDSRVLIPRPETELLVEQAIARAGDMTQEPGNPLRLLDLGTGSGMVAICLAKELGLPAWEVWATDISKDALDVARSNARRHGVLDQIRFLQGDLFEPIKEEGVPFDIIVSNPPYVAEEEYGALPTEVKDHEPRVALAGGIGGMAFIEHILREAPDFLSPGGWLIVEMAPGQTEKALKLAEESGGYGKKNRIRDYSGQHRVVMAQKK